MTEALKKTLLDFSNNKEPFLTHNHMYTADLSAHGGILFSLCDVAMGMAIMTLRQEMVVTVNASIDYLAAAAAGSTLTAVGKVDRMGGKMVFCSGEVTDETGKVIVQARCVMSFTGRPLPL